jgi:hypothetical protein
MSMSMSSPPCKRQRIASHDEDRMSSPGVVSVTTTTLENILDDAANVNDVDDDIEMAMELSPSATTQTIPLEWWKRPPKPPQQQQQQQQHAPFEMEITRHSLLVCFVCQCTYENNPPPMEQQQQQQQQDEHNNAICVMPANALLAYFPRKSALKTTPPPTTTPYPKPPPLLLQQRPPQETCGSGGDDDGNCSSCCTFCEQSACTNCLQTCATCQQPFCSFCSTHDYSGRGIARTVCLGCCSS